MQSIEALDTIGIFLKAVNLPTFNALLFNTNRCDPFVVIYIKSVLSGTTEIIQNSRNPAWTKLLTIPYKFQERQFLTFQVYYKHPNYAVPENKHDLLTALKKHHFLGEASMTLKELVESSGKIARSLINGTLKSSAGSPLAELIVHSDNLYNISPCNFRCEFQASNLVSPKPGKNDTYVAVQRMFEDGSWVVVFKNRAQRFDSYASLRWAPSSCSVVWLCNCDYRATLKFSVFSQQKSGVDLLIGETDQTCLEEVLHRTGAAPFDLYLTADNPLAHTNVPPSTGKLHIYNPNIDSLLSGAAATEHPVEVLQPVAPPSFYIPTPPSNDADGEAAPPSYASVWGPGAPPPQQQLQPSQPVIPSAPPLPPALTPVPQQVPSAPIADAPPQQVPSASIPYAIESPTTDPASPFTSPFVSPYASAMDILRLDSGNAPITRLPSIRFETPPSPTVPTVDDPVVPPSNNTSSNSYSNNTYSNIYSNTYSNSLSRAVASPNSFECSIDYSLSNQVAKLSTNTASASTTPAVNYLPSTFSNFIRAGCEIGMMFSVDFTQSNDGQKKGPKSLHRLTTESKARALAAINLLERAQQREGASQISPPASAAKLLCPSCTFENPAATQYCEMCFTLLTCRPSPDDAAAAATAPASTNVSASDGHANDMDVIPTNFDVTDEAILSGLNEYQKVILSVGSIIAEYDTDKIFPVMGFGAKVRNAEGRYQLNHCFPLTNDGNFEVNGLAGVMNAYHDIQARLEKSGPTNFTPTIRKCLEIARANPCTQAHPCYHVLLIITDGIVTDIRDTIDALVDLAHHPFSIIIVGVGEGDFGAMVELDGDGNRPLVSSGGETICRDIVQFVPFNRFVDRGIDALTTEVLAEIPRQFLDFMRRHGIRPINRTVPQY